MRIKIVLFIILSQNFGFSQNKNSYKIRTIAFYNVENLFDIYNDSLTYDDDRTPLGKDHWTLERYQQKVENISKIISEIGSKTTKTSPDIIGICEVENKQVVEDLIHHPNLINKGYAIIHFNSPDERGIDVALLYKKTVFSPISFKSHRLLLFKDENKRDYTRDQLVVGGLLDNEQFYFIVNHWPSRSGGETRSEPNRIAAAKLNRKIIDSISTQEPLAKIISMGDFNDDPNNNSFKKILKTVGEKKLLQKGDLFNPMEKLYKNGAGSLAYRDKWNLFDQLIITVNLINNNKNSYTFWKVGVYNPPHIITQRGKYKGYPLRSYSMGNYSNGYSDHFPVYLYLIKNISP